jgi:hypothetical protein
VPDARTTVTELVTGLGMLGYDDVAAALSARPVAMVSVSPSTWDELDVLHDALGWRPAFEAAFANGRAFLHAPDALRGRLARIVDWRGNAKPIDDELVPADLRVDHVYLVSCKYLSRVVVNAAPARLFDGLLRLRAPAERLSWFAATAPAELEGLLRASCRHAGIRDVGVLEDLSEPERADLRHALAGRTWPEACAGEWAALVEAVSERSAQRWRDALQTRDDGLRLLWRLLRIGPGAYFVLGVSERGMLRLRVLPSWDWDRRFKLEGFEVVAGSKGQPTVAWRADVRDRVRASNVTVEGHVEVRWSHGRFKGAPEAKVYLGTPHTAVPGYLPLA